METCEFCTERYCDIATEKTTICSRHFNMCPQCRRAFIFAYGLEDAITKLSQRLKECGIKSGTKSRVVKSLVNRDSMTIAAFLAKYELRNVYSKPREGSFKVVERKEKVF